MMIDIRKDLSLAGKVIDHPLDPIGDQPDHDTLQLARPMIKIQVHLPTPSNSSMEAASTGPPNDPASAAAEFGLSVLNTSRNRRYFTSGIGPIFPQTIGKGSPILNGTE